jgi:hypothetical protein
MLMLWSESTTPWYTDSRDKANGKVSAQTTGRKIALGSTHEPVHEYEFTDKEGEQSSVKMEARALGP